MLSVHPLSGGKPSDVSSYVANAVEPHQGRDGSSYTSGYYSEGGGAPSAWHGSIASELGLRGPVNIETFERLLGGELPDGTRFAEAKPDRRMGSDLTFSAPKSLSIAALACGDSRLIEAHNAAVARALEYIQTFGAAPGRGRA